MIHSEGTIAAIATARGEAGVAVIRVSGPGAWNIARTIFSNKAQTFEPGRFYHGWIAENGEILDEVLLLIFRTPHSYTGEDVVEIHCHGGDFITHKILDLVLRQGARLARPGEFTLRAYLNGKMDLTQAESVMDLVSARSERLMAQATGNLRNRSLGGYIDGISRELMEIQARIVASVDFPDEVEEPDRTQLAEALDVSRLRLERLKESARRNRIVREGVKVAILGMPNSGKSSLFNALLASERSIVTDQAGTTRDVVTESIEIDGIPVVLIDTAGIRETRQTIEMMGIERSWQAAGEAQIVMYLVDMSVGFLRYDYQILTKLDPESLIVIGNKKDLEAEIKPKSGWIYISARTGEGLDQVVASIREKIRRISHEEAGLAMALNRRQVACCDAVAESLAHAQEALANPAVPIDVVTVPLTDALRKLDELMGRDTAEEVLTEVFQQFCVGK